jgi:hypothetical protein
LHSHIAAERELQDELARISRAATMLRAQGLALAFEGDDASGWAASIIQATAQAGEVDIRGHGATRAAAAEDAWKRHNAPNPDSETDVRALPTLGN